MRMVTGKVYRSIQKEATIFGTQLEQLNERSLVPSGRLFGITQYSGQDLQVAGWGRT